MSVCLCNDAAAVIVCGMDTPRKTKGGTFHWDIEAIGLSVERPVRITRFVHSRDVPRHDHDFWEVLLFIGGHGVQESDAGRTPVSAGSGVIVRPGAFHDLVECEELELLNCVAVPSLFDNELAWLKEDRRVGRILRPRGIKLRPGSPRTIKLDAAAFARCRSVLEEVAVEHRRDVSPEHNPGMIARLILVLDSFASAWERDHGPAPEIPPYVRRAAALLDEQPARAWKMEDLAAESYSSPAHLSREFSTALGLPPMMYLTRLRVEHAAAMLRRTDFTVNEIGRRVGYPRPSHFISRFRDYFDITPGEYRRRQGSGFSIGSG